MYRQGHTWWSGVGSSSVAAAAEPDASNQSNGCVTGGGDLVVQVVGGSHVGESGHYDRFNDMLIEEFC